MRGQDLSINAVPVHGRMAVDPWSPSAYHIQVLA